MARANRTGVPGLTLIKSGPRAGRYQLDFHYTCPVDRTEKRVGKLYPAELKTAAIKADAMRRVHDALTGALAKREAEERATAAKVTIASVAAEVVAFRAAEGGSPATLLEFRSIVTGIAREGRPMKGAHVVRHLGHLAPHELDSEKLAGFVDALKAGGASPLTIRNVFKVLGHFIKIVRVRKLDPDLRSNPIRDAYEEGLALPSKRRALPVFVAQVDVEKLLSCAAVPLDRRVRYAFAFLTGMRDGEIAGLTWRDLELDVAGEELARVEKALAKIGGIQDTKTAASNRVVPLHRDLVAWLRVWRAEGWRASVGREPKPDDPVFPKAPAAPGRDAKAKPWRPDSARRLRADLALAGAQDVDAIDFHATRRTFASMLEAAKVPHELIERLLGHEPRSVLGRHYAAPDLGVLREAVSRLSLTSSGRLRAVS